LSPGSRFGVGLLGLNLLAVLVGFKHQTWTDFWKTSKLVGADRPMKRLYVLKLSHLFTQTM